MSIPEPSLAATRNRYRQSTERSRARRSRPRRSLRRRFWVLAAVVVAVVCVAQLAASEDAHAAGARLQPYTATQTVNAAVADAHAYWGTDPGCGILKVEVIPTGYGEQGEAGDATCTIMLSQTWLTFTDPTWRDFMEVCRAMTHEWGHLVLGENYFAATNPAEPWHSPEPDNIMYRTATVIPSACQAHAPHVVSDGGHVYATAGQILDGGMKLSTTLGH